MKKNWSNPELKNLTLEETREDDLILESEEGNSARWPDTSNPDSQGPWYDKKWQWRCSYCNTASGFIYETRDAAQFAFYACHAPLGFCKNRPGCGGSTSA